MARSRPSSSDDRPAEGHRPVLHDEVVHWLNCAPGKRMADVTVGLGGHAAAVLDACAPDGLVIGIDRDDAALAIAGARLDPSRARLHRGASRMLPAVMASEGLTQVDGVLFDLGVSSLQLDTAERGFSFQVDGPLDMRMDRRQDTTAADVVNTYSEEELTAVIRTYGEERWAAAIARAIVRRREDQPIARTRELADLVRGAIPSGARAPHPHPATRTFQALRIAVNREIEDLDPALDAALSSVAPQGRVVVIAFHSLEDRIVKRAMRRWEGVCVCPSGLPLCRCGRRALARVLTGKPITPSAEEIRDNPRSRSAKLRVAERLAAAA